MNIHEKYMHRCLELAAKAAGYVSPNPMVGAVLVYDDRIIGEGFHAFYGQAHAEVNCVNSVAPEDKTLVPDSTLYVSLEPCAHFGKTPPCADMIIREKIKKVVIGCRDPFKEVDGKGIERLRTAGIEVVTGILEEECKTLNKRFFTFHTAQRPYIVLKWAETANGKIANNLSERLLISNKYTNRKVHQWRGEEAAILVGTNTVMKDNPELTNRLWTGPSPVRLVIDMDLNIPADAKVFNNSTPTIVLNKIRHSDELSGEDALSVIKKEKKVYYYQVTGDVNIVYQLSNALYQLKIQSVLVEGGARLLQSFIDKEMWDEARVITNETIIVENGLNAPVLKNYYKTGQEKIVTDILRYYQPLTQNHHLY